MSFSPMLRRFGATATLIAIRAAVCEGYRPARSTELTYDPWFALDFDYRSAWAGAPVAVAW